MRPGDWLFFPVPKDQPLAALEVEIGGQTIAAYRENDQAMIRCPALSDVQRVTVRAGGKVVHTEVIRIS